MEQGREGETGKPEEAKPAARLGDELASSGRGAVKQTGAALGEAASAGSDAAKQTGELAQSTASAAASTPRLLTSAGLRAVLALAKGHLGAVAGGVGTLVLAGAGGYLLGRRSRPRPA